MANENKKDFNAMLHDSKDMPKFQTITDEKSIEKYGGNRIYFAPPIEYDTVMKLYITMRIIIEEKEEKPQSVCWINEREKILSFHFEDGYVRKEFHSKEEFRTFIVSAASGGYRIQ